MKKNDFEKELVGLISYLTNFEKNEITLLEPITEIKSKTLYENILFEYKGKKYTLSLNDEMKQKKAE